MIQMFRYISVLMLLFFSAMVSAQSTIKVMTVSHGTVTVDKSSASKDATVTITVTPSSGYYFQKKNLEVVKTVNPNLAWASGEIPIAGTITVSGSDPSDLSKSRKYTFTVPDDGYELQVSAIFTACKKITADMVTLSATNFTYNGIDQKPTVSVKGLTEGVSYTVSFADSSWKEVGTYSVSVTGKSKYKGIVTKAFTISSDEEFKVKLNKSKLVLQKGKTETLKATVSPSTLIDKSVTWKSSNTAVATVTSAGKIKGVKAGTATITCTSVVTGAKATCKVTVGYVKLDQAEAVIKKGKSLTLKATVYPTTLADKSVKWESSNAKIATVSSSGKVTGVKVGTATITCTSVATGLSTTCKVTIGAVTLDQKEVAIKKGKTVTLTPTVSPSSLEDKSVTWKSSDETVVTVSTSGKIKGIKYGTATITCTSNATGLSTTCKVIVGNVTLSKSAVAIKKGKSLTLTAKLYPSTLTDKSVKWESSNTKYATVSSDGKVTGVKVGAATITCTSVATGLSTTCKVTIGAVTLDQKTVAIKKGKTVTLTPTVYPSSLEDKSVTWKSSDETVATVSTAGKVKGIKYGTATITCTSNATGLTATCKVTVTASSGTRSLEGDDDDDATGIDEVNVEPTEEQPYDVYDLSGRKVAHQVTTLDGLPNGIYIVNGKKVLKK